MLILIIFAFLAGVVTILSPCILPILPIILSTSLSNDGSSSIKKPLGVVLGFTLSFTFFTLFLATLVKATGISSDVLRTVSVVIIATFGFTLLIPKLQYQFELLASKLTRLAPKGGKGTGLASGMIIGASLGLLWTPCVGPILASVITLAISGDVNSQALLVTLAYSLGTSSVMFLIILGGQKLLNKVPWLLKNTAKIQKIFGIIMIITAGIILFELDREFQNYILDKFPGYGEGLTQFEENDLIRDNIDVLLEE